MMFLAIYNDVPVYVAHLALWTDSPEQHIQCSQMYHVPSKSSNSVRCVGPENQRCSQRHGFFAVCDVDLFVNNGAENIGCSLDRDRCQCDAYYYYYFAKKSPIKCAKTSTTFS